MLHFVEVFLLEESFFLFYWKILKLMGHRTLNDPLLFSSISFFNHTLFFENRESSG